MEKSIEKKGNAENAIMPALVILTSLLMALASILYLIFWVGETIVK
ncbi:hypothetical protein [Dysgonomonas sp. BGC7]|nr:hypothetical protein [Dysgonomonas sp. BGC7]MBD8390012.1 hypothetical protein [Dysgonomonas sp. BGC7]